LDSDTIALAQRFVLSAPLSTLDAIHLAACARFGMFIMGTRSAANRAPVLQSVNRRDDVLSHGFRIGAGGTRPCGGSCAGSATPEDSQTPCVAG